MALTFPRRRRRRRRFDVVLRYDGHLGARNPPAVAEEASQLCSQELDCEYYYHEPDEALSWQSHGFRVSAKPRKLEMARVFSVLYSEQLRGVLVSQSLYYIACKCSASREGGVLA